MMIVAAESGQQCPEVGVAEGADNDFGLPTDFQRITAPSTTTTTATDCCGCGGHPSSVPLLLLWSHRRRSQWERRKKRKWERCGKLRSRRRRWWWWGKLVKGGSLTVAATGKGSDRAHMGVTIIAVTVMMIALLSKFVGRFGEEHALELVVDRCRPRVQRVLLFLVMIPDQRTRLLLLPLPSVRRSILCFDLYHPTTSAGRSPALFLLLGKWRGRGHSKSVIVIVLTSPLHHRQHRQRSRRLSWAGATTIVCGPRPTSVAAAARCSGRCRSCRRAAVHGIVK